MRVRLLIFLFAACFVPAVIGCGEAAMRRTGIQHYVRGKLMAEHGALDGALVELALAMKANPSLAVAYVAAGDIHRKRGNHELARGSYEGACRANPYAFKPQYHLGLTYQRLARAARAVEKAHECLRRAVQIYLRAIALEPEDFETNLNISACYFQLGKYDLAEQYCKAAIKIEPDDPHAHSNLGIIYDSQNKLYDAIREYKVSLEFDTNQPKLLVNLGSTYMRQNRLKGAIHAFEIAIKLEPNDPVPWEQIGSCRYRLRDYEKAHESYLRAVQLDKNSPTAYRGLGVVYMTSFILDQRETGLRDKALSAWHASLELEPHQEDLLKFVRKYAPKYTGPEL